jgi:hypothetical protein
MTNKKILAGLLSVVLVGFVLMGGGCSNGTTDDPAGSGGIAEITALPSFDGDFVANETEATTLAIEADGVIDDAIAAALSYPLGVDLAVVASGHYYYNGVDLVYTVTRSDSYPTAPYTVSEKDIVKIDGTYGAGYKVAGRYDFDVNLAVDASSNFTYKYKYDCVYTVSRGGKGMKIIATGDYTLSIAGATYVYAYKMHYAVYDNSNTKRYDYDYNDTVTF